MAKHEHAEAIKAWADGATIEYRLTKDATWQELTSDFPSWTGFQYRVKPEPKPDVEILYAVGERIFSTSQSSCLWPTSLNPHPEPNLKLIYDGETGKLKSAEIGRAHV